ncbi:ABC transporter substrate-binding protein [Kibdelosporangium aridum]|uniref:Branched-chain amino acid transport system substrate-binding protein n=1 Tax=Kibdelosporangium aridum TaxID=2030 RepID=A0A1W2AFF1_KIBAR|nr:ABC transporter substrate-binding protein [Kibdelosporangium aridum]SMC59343.1 branched-chain amino acid transport system substrate-binding protein [Kibdelosporangium aridum]
MAALSRRQVLGLLGAAGAATALPGCGSSLSENPGGGGGSGGGGAVKVGLVIPQSGTYAALGTDLKRGWDLWLERNGGKLGDFTVTTVTADEGETPQTGVPAVQKVLQSDGVNVVVGIVNSATALGSAPLVAEAKKLLLVSNAGAAAITDPAKLSPYVWRTSFQNAQVASVLGTYLGREKKQDSVYVIAPDYAAGTEVVNGFTKAIQAAGGTVAGSAKPPFATTTDYQPFLSGIRSSGAKATFCFFSGAEAIAFVKQYQQFGLAGSIPLYGSGFLTEGKVLEAQGDAALGVQTSLHYSDQLDNPANKAFVEAYRAKYNESPSCFSLQAWDSANVLSRALKAANAVDGDSLAKALGSIGSIDESPRGPWTFENQNPKQNMYLRTVQRKDGKLVNAITTDLGPTGQFS